MLKVILADDEPYIVLGLSLIIDWEKEGFEIVGTADNGQKALELIRDENPDLVITDIKMPIMTGLELLEKSREEGFDSEFVILSGYNEFDYAKTAMKYRSIDYLLKPIDKDELLGVLEKVRTNCSQKERLENKKESRSGSRLFEDFIQSLEASEDNAEELYSAKALDKEIMDSLLRAVETNQKERITELSGKIYERFIHLEEHFLRLGANYLLFGLLHLAVGVDADINQKEILTNIVTSTFEDVSIEEAGVNLTNMLLEFGDYLVQLRGHQSQSSLLLVEADIKEHYMENLTLKDLGKKYYVNSAYLGQMFKKQYGESFKDYLNRIRMVKAEELLLNTNLKIHEIAEEVGYSDVDYFINRFISYAGCTPAKYRKQTH